MDTFPRILSITYKTKFLYILGTNSDYHMKLQYNLWICEWIMMNTCAYAISLLCTHSEHSRTDCTYPV